MVPVVRAFVALDAPMDAPPCPDDMAQSRRHLLKVPMTGVWLACLGWLPGGIIFPLGIVMADPTGSRGIFAHFMLSFAISGMIAATYSFFGVQLVVLRAMYPRMTVDAQDLRSMATAELRKVEPRLRLGQLFAGAIPLVSAAMMAAFGSDSMPRTFRLLVTALIVLGMAGFGFAITITRQVTQTLAAITSGSSPVSSRSA